MELESDSIDDSFTHIFTLNKSCYHEIFDWLTADDVISIGQTCTRLQMIAGDYYQLAYGVVSARAENGSFSILTKPINVFSQYIRKISILGDSLDVYRNMYFNCSNALKQVRVRQQVPVNGALPIGGFQRIKEILNGIEVLEMNECFIEQEFYKYYLKYCPNVKSLSISRSSYNRDKSTIIGSGNQWMHRKYSKLEHFELTDVHEIKSNEMIEFFKINPNIRSFTMDAHTLWENRHSMLASGIKFDKLAIDVCQSKLIDSNNQTIIIKDSFYHLLHELYKRNFYHRLHLYIVFVDKQTLEKMTTLCGIELIAGDIVHINRPLHLLNTIAVWCGNEMLNVYQMPKHLQNIERMFFHKIYFNHVLTFIRNSPKLRTMKIVQVLGGNDFRNFNLAALNRDRQQLAGACKVCIYLLEDTYLATKWAQKSIKFNLIQIKRYESLEWGDLSAKSRYLKEC